MATYGVFLMALFAIAVGLSFLETSCNTYSSMIGPKESSTLRLNISQTFSKYLIFTEGEALHRQMETLDGAGKQQLAAEMLQRTLQPYQFIIMVLVVLLVIVAITQFPRCKPLDKEEHETKATIGETLRYLACNSRFRFGIMAQFFYVGMQTAVWSFTIRLALQMDAGLNERAAANYVIYALQLAFSVSLVCFVVVLLYFGNEHRLETAESR